MRSHSQYGDMGTLFIMVRPVSYREPRFAAELQSDVSERGRIDLSNGVALSNTTLAHNPSYFAQKTNASRAV
jgi:hypothetical protein